MPRSTTSPASIVLGRAGRRAAGVDELGAVDVAVDADQVTNGVAVGDVGGVTK